MTHAPSPPSPVLCQRCLLERGAQAHRMNIPGALSNAPPPLSSDRPPPPPVQFGTLRRFSPNKALLSIHSSGSLRPLPKPEPLSSRAVTAWTSFCSWMFVSTSLTEKAGSPVVQTMPALLPINCPLPGCPGNTRRSTQRN